MKPTLKTSKFKAPQDQKPLIDPPSSAAYRAKKIKEAEKLLEGIERKSRKK